MTQDMATMQQHCITSPTPAATMQQDSSGDPLSDSDVDSDAQHETSRTDSDHSDSTRRSSSTTPETDGRPQRRFQHHRETKKCQNNNEITENNGNLPKTIMTTTKFEKVVKVDNAKTECVKEPTSLKEEVVKRDDKDADNEDNEDSSSQKSNEKESGVDSGTDVVENGKESPITTSNNEDAEMKYLCPICDKMLTSQHDFTLHIRSHNNDTTDTTADEITSFTAKGYSCKICSKVLSSSSSLDRHVLVHSGERPFKCRVCGVAFTTNGNMHRHMRTHNSQKNVDYESDGSTDSTGSLNQNGKSPGSPTNNNNAAKKRRVGSNITNEGVKVVENVSPVENSNKRKATEVMGTELDAGRRRKGSLGDAAVELCPPQRFKCPVCDREDFASLNVLETHLESTHPEYKVRCRSCNLDFKNHRVLNLHRFMVHHDEEAKNNCNGGPSVVGFRDLTFMDFSSEKFPHIARAVCEQKLHQASSVYHKFQCDKCVRAFPCGSALSIHQQSCCGVAGREKGVQDRAVDVISPGDSDAPTDLSQRKKPREQRLSSDEEVEDKKREDFFAGLDLQNKSVPTSPVTHDRSEANHFENGSYFHPDTQREGKDLADIQSIISVTSAGGLRLQDLTKSPVLNGSITPSDKSYSDTHEEEQQDCFAAEFRRMKLKGEFPCRLCTAVFPNLRALKGHNRAHLTTGNVFRCNMCPYSSTDKAILVRHMRSHNGDRPYECALCNYAFTTKANCERHLRNRHSKLTRDEVKESIIYHPSEDPTNDVEFQSKVSGGSDVKRSLIFNTSTEDLTNLDRNTEDKYQSNKVSHEKVMPLFEREARLDSERVYPQHASPLVIPNCERPWETHEVATMTSPKCGNAADDSESDNQSRDSYENDKYSSNDEDLVNLTKNNNNNNNLPPFKLAEHQRNNNAGKQHQFTQSAAVTFTRNINSPLDLSMDALDLSKKTLNTTTADDVDDSEPQDLSKKSSPPEFNNNNHNNHVKKPLPFDKLQQLQKTRASASPPSSQSPTPTPIPKLDLNVANFYATNPHLMYLNNASFPFPAQNPFSPLGPYFMASSDLLQNANNFHEFTAELRERILKDSLMRAGLQMSGGTMLDPIAVATAAGKLQQLQAMAEIAARSKEMKYNEVKVEEQQQRSSSAVKEDKIPPGNLSSGVLPSSQLNVAVAKQPRDGREVGTSSVKMVIKNGVLMPKQKQRRYRTERPYVCDHCSARFTLRSNMERHIKQQHPDFWTQRQRGSGGSGRRSQNIHSNLSNDSNSQSLQDLTPKATELMSMHVPPTTTLQIPNLSIIKNYALSGIDVKPKSDDLHETKDKSSVTSIPTTTNNNSNSKVFISDEVKYAIAQQLKSKLNNTFPGSNQDQNEADEDDELVIDEEDDDDEDREDRRKELTKPEKDKVTGANSKVLSKESTPTLKRPDGFEEGYKSFKDTFFKGMNADMKDGGSGAYRALQGVDLKSYLREAKERSMTAKEGVAAAAAAASKDEGGVDLVSVKRLLDNATTHTHAFRRYFPAGAQDAEEEGGHIDDGSEEDEEGLVAPSDNSGSDENRSDPESGAPKKKSAYSLAPNRVSCPYCHRKFPWSSSLRRHVLTHTGQKPYKCAHCPLLFTTKSNCDRHLLRKHGNAGTTSNTSPEVAPQVPQSPQTSYTMRNVPERPFKCNHCPSSTFSTLSNLKKHVATKHRNPNAKHEEISINGDDSHADSDEDPVMDDEGHPEVVDNHVACRPEVATTLDTGRTTENVCVTSSNVDLPFKCHLCEGSYGERQEALEHIKECHPSEFELLMSKGALENGGGGEDNNNVNGHEEGIGGVGGEESLEQLRGKFPDYANRKVMCAFCMRRFWSAEDLRRHMRTHTGERPFSCDICRRRFTLKHSMLRHRKKHSANDASTASGDEDTPNNLSKHDKNYTGGYLENNIAHHDKILKGYIDTQIGKNDKIYNKYIEDMISNPFKINMNGHHESPKIQGMKMANINNNNNNNIIEPVKGLKSRYIMENPWPVASGQKYPADDKKEGDDETNLIGNLLGIEDKSIIDKMLVSKSADDAAKLLGVGGRE